MGLNVGAAFGSEGAKKSLEQMAATEAENSRLYKPLQEARPLATVLGESAPLIAAPMLGAGVVGTAASAALPGLMEYGTGEERLARGAMGAVGGALGNVAGNAIARVIKPTQTVTGAQQGAIDAADRLGVKLTSGEASGNRALKWAEAAAGDMPIASGVASKRIAGNDVAISNAAARSIGQNANEITEPVFAAARQSISGEYSRILGQVNIPLDRSFNAELNAITGSKVMKSLRDESVDGIVKEIRSVAAKGVADGEWFQANKSALDAAIRSAYTTPGQAGKARALEQIEGAMNRAAMRSLPKPEAEAYKAAERKWANLRILETGKVTENGKVLPGRLNSAMESRYRQAFKEGKIKGELADIAKLSSVLRPPPQSGTAPRAIYSGLVGGAAFAEPTTAAAMVAAPTLLQGVTASPAMRNYMTRGLVNLSPEEERLLRLGGSRLGLLGVYGASQ